MCCDEIFNSTRVIQKLVNRSKMPFPNWFYSILRLCNIKKNMRRTPLRRWPQLQIIAPTYQPFSKPLWSYNHGWLHPNYILAWKNMRASGSTSGPRSTCPHQPILIHKTTWVSRESWATSQQGCKHQKRSDLSFPQCAMQKIKQRDRNVFPQQPIYSSW